MSVLAAAKELNYVPNIFGQLLRSNSSGAIGIIVPSLQNPFYNQVVLTASAKSSRKSLWTVQKNGVC